MISAGRPGIRNNVARLAMMIADTFNRIDGTSLLTSRSDGGVWNLGALNDMEINGNRLVRTANGIIEYRQWIYATYDRGSFDTVTATFTFVRNTYIDATDGRRKFPPVYAWVASDSSRNSGVEMWMSDDTFLISSFPANAWFATPPEISGGWFDGLPHVVELSYTHSTRRCQVHVDGVSYVDATAPTSIGIGNVFGLLSGGDYATAGCYFDDLTVIAT